MLLFKVWILKKKLKWTLFLMLIRNGFHANTMHVSIVTARVLAWLAETLLCLILHYSPPIFFIVVLCLFSYPCTKDRNTSSQRWCTITPTSFLFSTDHFFSINVPILCFKCLGIFAETVKYCSVTLVAVKSVWSCTYALFIYYFSQVVMFYNVFDRFLWLEV